MTHFSDTLKKLIVYRNILQDDLIQMLMETRSSDDVLRYELVCELIKRAESLGLAGNILHKYIIYLIARDENMFSITAEKTGGIIGSGLSKAVIGDIEIIKEFIALDLCSLLGINILSSYSPTTIHTSDDLDKLTNVFLDEGSHYKPDHILSQLNSHYIRCGYGNIAGYTFFRWDEHRGLVGIKHFDPVTFADIVGYERQKQILITNMQAFLSDKPYHNVLLAGARGTGKSSSVKALVNEYYRNGLRLVEVPKQSLKDIPKIMEILQKYGKKFILFLDDLSFEENEVEYKYLKSVLEGGVERKPENVLICATSNRRHLIRESWHDRSDNTDDVHRFDSVHEKLSLSDRFGITLTYLTPSQEEFIHIVEETAKKKNLPLSSSRLKAEAIQWEMLHSGRSGRTAQQLITHLLGSNHK